jgi:hypothetical protein
MVEAMETMMHDEDGIAIVFHPLHGKDRCIGTK